MAPPIPPPEEGSFSAPPSTHIYDGFLLDMDGTIIDSTDAIEKHWRRLGAELNFDAEVLLATSHGRRSIDTLRILAPEKASWDYVRHIEGQIPVTLAENAHPIPGAPTLLSTLTAAGAPWAIVTSGTSALLEGWLTVMGLPKPPARVVAEDVEHGKPDPECYKMGQARIGLGEGRPRLMVVEDSPSGVKSGKAAGCVVLALATTHALESLRDAGADFIVRDLKSVKVGGRSGSGGGKSGKSGGEGSGGGWEVQIVDAWVERDDKAT